MRICVLTIGSEILIGHTVNTNLAFIGDKLATNGYTVSREVCIPDEPEVIRAAVQAEIYAADILITIGGLGPTRDDITRQIVADTLKRELIVDENLAERIRQFLEQRHARADDEQVRNQAALPAGAAPLENLNGTAPGIWCPWDDGKVVIMVPGPPRELCPIFTNSVIPRLRKLTPPTTERRMLKICGIPESVVARQVDEILDRKYPVLEVAYCARPSVVDVRLTAPRCEAATLDAARADLEDHFGEAVLQEESEDVAEAVAELLTDKGLRLATAESCTGGGIATRLTERPGASRYLQGSLVCYVNEWKKKLLGVKAGTLQKHGAVSAETAGEMLDGLLQRDDIDAGIAVTGIAGPGGGTPDKPVGLVFVATGVRDRRAVERYVFPGDRHNVRLRTVAAALDQLRRQLL